MKKEWKKLFKYVYAPYHTRLKKIYDDFKMEDWFLAQELIKTNSIFQKEFNAYIGRTKETE